MDHRFEPELDDLTAERLLEGAVSPDDAPHGYQAVARTLQAAASMATEVPADGAESAVAAFLQAIPTRRNRMLPKWKIAAAVLAGGLTMSTGLAAAGALPGAAQDVASDALAKVGISVPANSNSHANSRGKSAQHRHDSTSTTAGTAGVHGQGSEISGIAHDDSNVGVDHGAAVCTAASDGNCQAGQHGQAGHEHPGTTVTTVDHPNGDDNPGLEHSDEGSSNSTNGSSHSGSGS